MSSDPALATPMNVSDLSATLKRAAIEGLSLGVMGAGTKLDHGAAPTSCNLMISTSNMRRVVEHASGDLVVTAQAGVPLSALQEQVAVAGQWLALDPPEPGATVGGVVAAAASGPRRLLYGTPRDLLIGLTVVLADGTVARSGGKVVKNVAGYDLGKLFTGSFGTLGVITECTFRLHAVPPARRVVTVNTDDPGPLVRDILRSPLEPSALEWDGTALHVVFETVEPAAETQARATVDLAGAGEISDRLPSGFAARPWKPGDVAVKVTHRISSLSAVLDAVRRQLPGCRIAAHAGSGVVHAGWAPSGADVAAVLETLRADVAAHDGTLVVVDAPGEIKAQVDVWGPVRGVE